MPRQPGRLRAVLVDDEISALRAVGDLLAAHDAIEIAGTARSVAEARRVVAATEPDVVFLDVEIRRETGVELLCSLKETTLVVVVTAYDDYAVDAFEWGVVDYLLKPVTVARLEQCVARLIRQKTRPAAKPATPEATGLDRPVPVPTSDGTRLILLKDVLWIEARNTMSALGLAGGEMVVGRRSLSAWQATLPAGPFLRVSRSLLVRTDRIAMVRWRSQGGTELEFIGSDERLVLGRAAAERLKRVLEQGNQP